MRDYLRRDRQMHARDALHQPVAAYRQRDRQNDVVANGNSTR